MMQHYMELLIIAHTAGFVMGVLLTYASVRFAKKILLDSPTKILSMDQFREYYQKDQQIKEINSVTKAALDRLSHHGA